MRIVFATAGLLCVVGGVFSGVSGLHAQAPLQARVPSARTAANVDLAGYWVTAITEDWRLRMITPPKGDYQNLPLNEAGVKLLRTWDPAADRARGDDCKSYGAAAIMRMPTRMHVTWQDDNTLKIDFDYGRQTRLVYFRASPQTQGRTLQGRAVGEWIDFSGRLLGTRVARQTAGQIQAGLRITTTGLLPQYVRQNGAPISEEAVVTDMIEHVRGPMDSQWLIVKTIVRDPVYFTDDLVVSSHFKREPDASKWNPTPCEIEPPPEPRPLREPPPR